MEHSHEALSGSLQTGLGAYYLLVAFMNLGFAAYWYYERKNLVQTGIWAIVAVVFFIHSLLFLSHHGFVIPGSLEHFVDYVMNPVSYFVLAVVALVVMLWQRRFFTDPVVAWTILQVTLLFSGWAMTNDNFKDIITKPDNVPIVILIFSVGYTTWLALRKAVINDDLIARGQPPLEKLEDEKVLVWPDLVYTEMIAMHVDPDLLGHLPEGAAGATCVAGAHPEPLQGAMVFPWPAGDAGLLRPVDGGRRLADDDHRRPRRAALHRLQPEG
jgi:hypothetical protein